MDGYQGFKKRIGWFLRFLWQFRTVNPENLPTEGGYLLCCNHTSMADVIPLAIETPQPISYMAKSEVLKVPLIGHFLKALGAFPIRRGAADLGALRKAIAIIETGGVVGMFPQGTRRPGVKLGEETVIHGGPGMIVCRAKCDVLPVCLKTKSNKVRLFHKTEVVFGKRIPFAELPEVPHNAPGFEQMSAYIFDKIRELDKDTEQ